MRQGRFELPLESGIPMTSSLADRKKDDLSISSYWDSPYSSSPKSTEATFPSSVWGPTCDSIDLVSPLSHLPAMEVGDWLYFEDMGAYTVCAASTFNGFPRSAVIHTDGGSVTGRDVRQILSIS